MIRFWHAEIYFQHSDTLTIIWIWIIRYRPCGQARHLGDDWPHGRRCPPWSWRESRRPLCWGVLWDDELSQVLGHASSSLLVETSTCIAADSYPPCNNDTRYLDKPNCSKNVNEKSFYYIYVPLKLLTITQNLHNLLINFFLQILIFPQRVYGPANGRSCCVVA